jgi:hypothetical protein
MNSDHYTFAERMLDLIEENHELRLKLAESIKERLELLELLKNVGISE